MPYEEVEKIFTSSEAELLTPKHLYGKTIHSKVNYLCEFCGKQHTATPKLYREGRRTCTHERQRGVNHPLYNHDLTPEERDRRRDYKHGKWSKAIIKRDNYRCLKCNAKGTMHAHHIKPYLYFEEFRTDMNNGVTLCKPCHNALHGLFGWNHEEPQKIDWDEQWKYFKEEYIIPPPKKKRRKRTGVYDPSFSWCPQQIFELDGELYSTLPYAKGFLVSVHKKVVGKRNKQLSRTSTFIAYDNNKTRTNTLMPQIHPALFELKLTEKVPFKECYNFITRTNKTTTKEEAHKANNS